MLVSQVFLQTNHALHAPTVFTFCRGREDENPLPSLWTLWKSRLAIRGCLTERYQERVGTAPASTHHVAQQVSCARRRQFFACMGSVDPCDVLERSTSQAQSAVHQGDERADAPDQTERRTDAGGGASQREGQGDQNQAGNEEY